MASTTTIRRVAAAALVGTLIALVVDVLLQNALNVARLGGRQYLPWWVTGNVLERSTWVATAGLLWIAAPRVAAWLDGHREQAPPPPAAAAWTVVAHLMIGIPVLWIVASMLVRLVKITLAGDWAVEGPLFFDSSFHANLATAYFPWLAGGLVVASVSRHLPVDRA